MIKMSKTLTLMTIVILLITSILVTGLSATTFTQVVVAQGNSTSLETTSNSNSVPHLNSTTGTTTDSASTIFITYENSTWGIKIQYPSSWEKQTTGNGVTFIVLSNGTNANSDKNLQQFLA
jgi:hypothetical protein